MNSWVAWYVDESGALISFSSENTKFEDLPNDGCIKFFIDLDDGAMGLSGYDFYFQSQDAEGNLFIGCDIAQRERNIESEIRRRYKIDKVILGKWTSTHNMRIVDEEFQKWRDMVHQQ